jgi:hypothetical protein
MPPTGDSPLATVCYTQALADAPADSSWAIGGRIHSTLLDSADARTQRPRPCRFSRLAARFSSNDLAGFFLPSFFRSMPLLMSLPSHGTVFANSILASRPGLRTRVDVLLAAVGGIGAQRPPLAPVADVRVQQEQSGIA